MTPTPSPFAERLAAFRARRLSWVALWVLVVAFVLSLGAELLANNQPLVLRFRGEVYVPVFVTYAPQRFGITDTFVVDYRALVQKFGAGDWAVFPPIAWGPFESDESMAQFPSPP